MSTTSKTPAQNDTSDQNQSLRGQDTKKARGLSEHAGHSPNEAGTDQKVEDAKREKSQSRD